MKNSKNNFNTAGQSVAEVNKSQKHDVNLQKNSSLYFQIGLVLCLLGTYVLFEMEFQKQTTSVPKDLVSVEPTSVEFVEPFVVEAIKLEEPEPRPPQDVTGDFKVVKNDRPIVETLINTTAQPYIKEAPAVDPNAIVVEEPEDFVEIDFVSVEMVPVYPGCEKLNTNEERKQCMSEKIQKLVAKKFNPNVGSNHGISGIQRIQTQFTIDKMGNVTTMKIRGQHNALEREAERVINAIPKMKPGLQRNIPVGVIYTLPIVYDARN